MAPKRPKQTISKARDAQCPAPFSKAPASLEPLLSQLDPAHVYITHIDRHPPQYKKLIFTLTILVNTTVAGLLLWRVYAAAPKYLAIAQTFLGYISSATVDTERTTRKEQIWILVRRTLMFFMDYLLFQYVLPWPMTFFFEQPANPVTWRWSTGFQPQEVVVRVSRTWGAKELMQGNKQAEQSPYWKTRVLPAISEQWMQKTGYLMMDGSWDLEFELMQDVRLLLERDEVKMEHLDTMVLVHYEAAGWLAYRFGLTKEDAEEENRKKMMAFKSHLSSIGKESLFWKWQEIVEEERDADGGFTSEGQQRIAVRVAKEFEKNGLDFENSKKVVGEIEAIPAGSP
ncbi:hypothetical protein LTR37_018090 [Vermiconidia calcicola]|uniref:Uncharacterized protein n=1 Tax=Vermiconidia calcicola TaxID=1690605 RepID=A0ACC3MJR8_9PEZI|nr:hypothetical protein LTR37_018090 [Vermiconidia calcicola]